MSEYTAEDFAQANLATKGKHDAARRTDPNLAHQWQVYGSRQERLSDQEMVYAGWAPVVQAPVVETPLTLKDLEVAWESAEVPTIDTPIREDDTVIVRNPDPEEFSVFTWPGYEYTPDEETRVLSRAPKREPWQDLADVLLSESVVFDSEDANIAARALHNAGVRVMGGDDGE